MDLSDYQGHQDAYCKIGQFWEDVYNRKWVHSFLGHSTPVEFEAQWLAEQSEAKVVD